MFRQLRANFIASLNQSAIRKLPCIRQRRRRFRSCPRIVDMVSPPASPSNSVFRSFILVVLIVLRRLSLSKPHERVRNRSDFLRYVLLHKSM